MLFRKNFIKFDWHFKIQSIDTTTIQKKKKKNYCLSLTRFANLDIGLPAKRCWVLLSQFPQNISYSGVGIFISDILLLLGYNLSNSLRIRVRRRILPLKLIDRLQLRICFLLSFPLCPIFHLCNPQKSAYINRVFVLGLWTV